MAVSVEQRNGQSCSGHLGAGIVWIELHLPAQQCAHDREQPISDTTQCAAMTMSSAAQRGVAALADWIMLTSHASPM